MAWLAECLVPFTETEKIGGRRSSVREVQLRINLV